MSAKVAERRLEEAIEQSLLEVVPAEGWVGREAEAGYGEGLPGGYQKRRPEEYDQSLCLIPGDVLDFVWATQPREWERLKEHYGA